MPDHILSAYRHRTGFGVEVRTADALDVAADVLVFGGSPMMRGRLEGLAGKEFRPFEGSATERPADLLRSDRLPWRRAVSSRYRTRKARIEWPPHAPAPAAAHIVTLTSDLFWLLRSVDRGLTLPKRVVLLPLGWRYPEVSAAAWVAALWQYGEEARRDLAERTFILADLQDPSAYLPLLNNHHGALHRLLRGWELAEASYVHPFRREAA